MTAVAEMAVGQFVRPAGRVAEWRWLSLVSLAIVAIIEIPYLLAFSQADNGWVFGGMLWSPYDFAQYASAMRQGATSNGWLIYDQLSHEAHDPAFIYPLYVGLGKLAALAGLGTGAAYHVAEIIGRVVLVLALYSATGLLFSDIERRRRALLVCLSTSGLGAVILALGIGFGLPLDWDVFAAADLRYPEFNTLLALFTAPHITLALAAMLFWARAYTHSVEMVHTGALAAMGACVLAVGMTNPFSLMVLVSVGCAYALVALVIDRALPVAGLVGAAVTALFAGPLVAYNAVVFSRDPFWGATYGAQNHLPTGPPLSLALAYGALLFFTIVAVPALLRVRTPGALLVLTWIGLATLLMYAPVPFQRRFGFGVHPMLALAATLGMEIAWQRLRPATGRPITWRWRLLRSSAAIALFGTTFTFFLAMIHTAARAGESAGIESAFHPPSVHQAAEWLSREASPADLVLAETQTANYISGWFPGRVYSAHWVATAGYVEKLQATSWFFRTADEDARQAFLHQLGVRYIVFGPGERAFGGAAPGSAAIRPVFETEGLTIYEVEGSAKAAVPRAASE